MWRSLGAVINKRESGGVDRCRGQADFVESLLDRHATGGTQGFDSEAALASVRQDCLHRPDAGDQRTSDDCPPRRPPGCDGNRADGHSRVANDEDASS